MYRIRNSDGRWIGADAVSLEGEKNLKNIHHPFEPDKSMNIDLSDVPAPQVVEQYVEEIKENPPEEV